MARVRGIKMIIEYECAKCNRVSTHDQLTHSKDNNLYKCRECGEEVVLSELEVEVFDLEREMSGIFSKQKNL